MTVSEITGIKYHEEEMVFFRNTLQSSFYIFHGAKLIDIFVDNKMHLVFVFSKSDHEKFKMLWKESAIEKDKVNNERR